MLFTVCIHTENQNQVSFYPFVLHESVVACCSMMLRINQVWFMLYMTVDMAVYFLYKIARGDFRHWINVQGNLSWVVSILMRLMIKVITDFTLIVQFRGQMELGGIYWLANMILNQLFCFISVYLYTRFADDNSSFIDDVHSNSTSIANIIIRCNYTDTGNATNTDCDQGAFEPLWFVVSGLFVLSVLSFGIFLRLINKNYLCTFYDARTGKEFITACFQLLKTDKEKFNSFFRHRSLNADIEPELKVWLEENWERWEEERPDWFTPAAIKSVPIDMLPQVLLKKHGGIEGARASIRRSIVREKEEKAKNLRRASAALRQVEDGNS